jgi:predicted nucleic acid-binding protein
MSRPPILFDTSIYIPHLRGQAYAVLIKRAVRTGRVRLSAVVLAELYAGTRSAADKADLDAALRAYRSLGFLVTPDGEDWARAGQALRRYGRAYGAVVPRQHMNDVLVLLCGRRVGAEVVTENVKPFARWARILRRMGLAVRVWGLERRAHPN